MIKTSTINKISRLLRAIDHPARAKILLAVGKGEACVCHLEATLGMRQAYISQHLMALRRAGILRTHREGRFIYYRLANPEILDVLNSSASALNILLNDNAITPNQTKCNCPKCSH